MTSHFLASPKRTAGGTSTHEEAMQSQSVSRMFVLSKIFRPFFEQPAKLMATMLRKSGEQSSGAWPGAGQRRSLRRTEHNESHKLHRYEVAADTANYWNAVCEAASCGGPAPQMSSSILSAMRCAASRNCCHGPVGSVPLGDVRGRCMVDQPLGQARGQHELSVGDGDEAVSERMEPESGPARLADARVEVLDGFEMSGRAVHGRKHPASRLSGELLPLGEPALSGWRQADG